MQKYNKIELIYVINIHFAKNLNLKEYARKKNTKDFTGLRLDLMFLLKAITSWNTRQCWRYLRIEIYERIDVGNDDFLLLTPQIVKSKDCFRSIEEEFESIATFVSFVLFVAKDLSFPPN